MPEFSEDAPWGKERIAGRRFVGETARAAGCFFRSTLARCDTRTSHAPVSRDCVKSRKKHPAARALRRGREAFVGAEGWGHVTGGGGLGQGPALPGVERMRVCPGFSGFPLVLWARNCFVAGVICCSPKGTLIGPVPMPLLRRRRGSRPAATIRAHLFCRVRLFSDRLLLSMPFEE